MLKLGIEIARECIQATPLPAGAATVRRRHGWFGETAVGGM